MSLAFRCPNCRKDIVVQYLKPGEEAICRSCGGQVLVPSEARATDVIPDYTTPTPEMPPRHEILNPRDLGSVLRRRRIRDLLVSIVATFTIVMGLLPTRLSAGSVLLLGVVSCCGAGIITHISVARNLRLRDRGFKEAGGGKGMQYLGASVEPGDEAFGRLPLFQKGSSREMIHVLTGAGEWVFDYEYKLGHRRPKKSHTVAVFQIPGARLPRFRLYPEDYTDRIDAALGFQDIDFAEDPEFSGQFRLRSKKEDLARQMCSTQLRAHLRRYPGLSFEGDGEWLTIFTRVRCKVQDLAIFIGDTKDLAHSFMEACKRLR